jgi:hypothetical protein
MILELVGEIVGVAGDVHPMVAVDEQDALSAAPVAWAVTLRIPPGYRE